MALEIFRLVGSIFVDTDKANESLQKTDKKATSVAETMGKAGKVAAGAAAAIGTAIIGTGTALVGMANDASKTADEIDKGSIRMGISTEKYQELAYAAGQCGVEMGTLESAAKKLEGTDLTMDEALASIMELGTAEERSAKAAELFGEKLAYTLSPLIEQSGEDFNGLIERSHELGLIMSEDAVKAGVAYGDLSSDLEQAFGMLKTNIGAALFPVLNSLIKKFIEFMPKIQELGERLGPLASDFIEKLLPPLVDLVEELLPNAISFVESLLPALAEIANSLVPVIVNLLQELLPVILQVTQDVLPVLVQVIQMLAPILAQILEVVAPILAMVLKLISPLLDLVMTILTPILNLVTALLTPLLELVSGILTPIISIISALLEPLTSLISMILEPLTGLLDILLEPLIQLLNMILPPLLTLIQAGIEWLAPKLAAASDFLKGFFNFLVEEIGNKLTSTLKNFGNFFKTVWEGIKTVFKTGVNFVINGINTLIRGLNKIKPPEWLSNLTGVKGVNFTEIPLLAKGGVIEQPGRVIVGEAGPEVLDLPKGATVSPLNNGIDYDKLAGAIINALREVAPELATNVNINGNKDRIVDVMVEANRRSIISSGKGVLT